MIVGQNQPSCSPPHVVDFCGICDAYVACQMTQGFFGVLHINATLIIGTDLGILSFVAFSVHVLNAALPHLVQLHSPLL